MLSWPDARYNDRVLRHFVKPTHGGTAGDVRVSLRRGSSAIEFSAAIENGRIARMRFRVRGCPHLIAAADLLCASLEDGEVEALRQPDVRRIIAPLALPVEKTGLALLLEDAAGLLYREYMPHGGNEN